MRLSQSELDKYHQHGYVVPDARLDEQIIYRLKEAVTRVMSTNPEGIRDNLVVSTKDFLLNEQLLRISGDGTPENPGIDANNRLIWGQGFLWPEADGDWRQLWNDKQLFLPREGYQKYKASWEVSHQVQLETTYQV